MICKISILFIKIFACNPVFSDEFSFVGTPGTLGMQNNIFEFRFVFVLV